MSRSDVERVHVETIEQWRAWLEQHHDTAAGVWLVTWRRVTGRPAPPYEQQIEEALCVGWVDSTARRLDDDRTMLYFAPRRRGSTWARSNKERVARLEAEGRMLPAGRAVVDRARADGSWTVLDGADALVVPEDLSAALAASPGARATWDGFPPGARSQMLGWIALAKRADTRARRVATVAERASRGERAL